MSAAQIHQTAIVSPSAVLEKGVTIGAYSIIGDQVHIGANTNIGSHCVIDGNTKIGANNNFYRYCSIGGIPQDKKYAGENTALVIGDGNTFREFVTVNIGTAQDIGTTAIADDNWIMAYVHIAHDCQIGSHTVIANSVQLAGHIHIGDWSIIGGLSAVHQFVRIGEHSMIGGTSSIRQDIPPYVIGAGDPFRPVGINTEGLSRRGFSANEIQILKEAYKILYRRKLNTEQAIIALKELQLGHDAVGVLIDFLESSTRGIVRP